MMGLEQSLNEVLMELKVKWPHLYVQAERTESNVIPTQLHNFQELSQWPIAYTTLCCLSTAFPSMCLSLPVHLELAQ